MKLERIRYEACPLCGNAEFASRHRRLFASSPLRCSAFVDHHLDDLWNVRPRVHQRLLVARCYEPTLPQDIAAPIGRLQL